jgi:predicted HAD superfamily Cof-like phosphohydrolase
MKMSPEDMVREFHRAAGLKLPDQPTLAVDDFFATPDVRQSFLAEEVDELREAEDAGDLVEIADALADIVYFAIGTAITYGIPFDQVFAEVHRSNMTKFDADGHCEVRPDGKILKGPYFERPRISQILMRVNENE